MDLIFEKSVKGVRGYINPNLDVDVDMEFPLEYRRSEDAHLPEVSELDVVRHFMKLSQKNFGVDTTFYPLGSCTMKYNPKFTERIADMPSFTDMHPLLPQLKKGDSLTQGSLEVLYEIEQWLCEITGMDAYTLQPLAGAHGEMTGVMMIAAYHKAKGNKKKYIIVPDSSHGTNPATAAIVGYELISIPSDKNGVMDIDELKKSGSTILFIDELHTIVGAGAAEGSIDASNILKPALARGEIQVVGATTLDEYRRYIEKDAALERRFQPVTVGEPTREEAVQILFGLRDRYEAHHKARITDEAIKAAVDFSDRYISDRYLPDKAIDLMDEAASRVRLATYISPPDMKALEDKLNALLQEKEEAVNNQNFERAAAIRDEEHALRRQMQDKKDEWQRERESTQCTVTENDIAEVVNAWTGIPVKQLTEDESEKLLHLEESLHKRVVGQDEAIGAVSRAIRRARAGLKDPKRPIGSYIFLGPTGVGKTELSKALAEVMFADEDAMIRLDMSEYMEPHSVSKLMGSPPGYVGYDDGGQLTERVRRKPYCVILLDEIEKAHPDVFNTLLQVLEDGRLTDSKGRTVDFRNTIIIMTSNVGASKVGKRNVIGFGAESTELTYARMKEGMLEELKKTFRPEFLNRVDEIIIFHQLEKEQTLEIVGLMLRGVIDRLRERGVDLTVTVPAQAHLASDGFDPIYGARPLRRAIQHQVEDSLSEEILAGRIRLGDKVSCDLEDGKLSFRKLAKEAD
ncbi:MAG: AAA family ATPase [Clostridia bacterium]|nr:AAA family ATPase [Clostridia bacterium]